MRSKLFVPAARPELFDKALAGNADAISFDLEDSVPDDGKEAARERLVSFLGSAAARQSGKILIVRINGLETDLAAADLAALSVVQDQVVVNLPKVESPDMVRAAAALTAAPLLLNIETPKGLRRASEIATAHPGTIGLQVGLNDLFAMLGVARGGREQVHSVLWQVRLAAGEAGCFAYDGAWPDLADQQGFRAESEMARDLGFLGKSCIHPSQVAIANEVFDKGEELARAGRLVAEAERASAQGRGAFTFDGKMIDRPAIEQARAMLRAAGRPEK